MKMKKIIHGVILIYTILIINTRKHYFFGKDSLKLLENNKFTGGALVWKTQDVREKGP